MLQGAGRMAGAFVFVAVWIVAGGCSDDGGGGGLTTLTVGAPNGGQTYYFQGADQTITWTSPNASATATGTVTISYTIDATAGTVVWTVVQAAVPNTGSYTWTIPNAPTTNCKVMIAEDDSDLEDESNAVFTIASPVLALTTPTGGETFVAGQNASIMWTGGGVQNLEIELSRDGNWANGDGSNVEILTSTHDVTTGLYSWAITGPGDNRCLIRISDAADGTPVAVSAAFTIVELALTAPVGGEEWEVGSAATVTWTSSQIATLTVELSRDGNWTDGDGSNVEVLSAAAPAGTGTLAVPMVTGPISSTCLVRLTDNGPSGVQVSSPAYFMISGIEVMSPNGGERLRSDTAHSIMWTSLGVTGTVEVDYSTNGVTWVEIASGVANSGWCQWIIPDGTNGTTTVRVSETVGTKTDESDANCVIYRAWFVNHVLSAAGDGLTWSTAFQDPQEGADVAVALDEVWISQGVYYDPDTMDATDAVVAMPAGVGLYGGFSGAESTKTARQVDEDVVIFDGEFGARGIIGSGNVTVDGITFTDCRSTAGGGGMVFAGAANVKIVDCTFDSNSGVNSNGGAGAFSGGSVTFEDCDFLDNEAGDGAGLSFMSSTSVVITDCIFTGNIATSEGGAIFAFNCSPVVTRCLINENEAIWGGGICGDISSPDVLDCYIMKNDATSQGGGVWIAAGTNPEFTNCYVAGNTASNEGGGFYYYDTDGLIINCTLTYNTTTEGGGMYLEEDAEPLVRNCIFYQNVGGLVPDIETVVSTPTVDYCCIVQVGYRDLPDNVDADPEMINPMGNDGTIGTMDDDAHLKSTSPCINAATTEFCPDHDLDNMDRPGGFLPEIGAFEY